MTTKRRTFELRSNRKYPFVPTVTDDPQSHTLALRALIEAVAIHERRTKDIDFSFVRVHELVDMGLITIKDGQFNVVDVELGDLADVDLPINPGSADDGTILVVQGQQWTFGDHGNIAGLGDDDHPQYTQWVQDEDITGQWDFQNVTRFADGDVDDPSITFIADDGTGFWRPAANTLAISTGGAEHWRISATEVHQDVPLRVTDNEGVFVENPDYPHAGVHITTFAGVDPLNNGIGNQLAFWEVGTGGAFTDRSYGFRIRHTGDVDLEGNLDFYRHRNDVNGSLFMRFTRDSDQIQFADGSAAEPVLTNIGDTDTGWYFPGADSLGASTGGSLRLTISSTDILSTVPYRGPAGSAATPTYSFAAGTDSDTGMFDVSDGILGFATQGTERFRIAASGQWGLAGANYGSAGEAIVSNGAAAAPTWQAVVLPSRQIISGAGLTGGGDLSADRTLAVGAGTGITVNADDVALSAATLASLALADSAVQPGDLAAVATSGDHGDLAGLTDDDHTQYVLRSILTTNGDLFVRLAGAVSRLGVGTEGQVLRVVSGLPEWDDIGGGTGVVETVVGTTDEIDVDDTDPANPVLSLAAAVVTSLALADTAVQPARQIISGAGLTGGGDLSADRTLAVGAGTGITVNADDVALSAATITSLGLADTAVQPARQIISGGGLTGGGNLSADRTLAVGAGTGITVNADDVAVDINGLAQDMTPDGAADFVMTYDASAGTLKKVLLDDLPGGGGGGTVDTIVAGDGILVDDTDPANPIVSVDEAFDFDWTDDHDWIVNDNASRGNLFTNSSTGVSAAANWGLTVDTANFRIFVAGPNRSSAIVTSGPTGAQAVLRTLGNYPIVFGTSNTYRGQITGAGGVELEGTLQTGGTITSLASLVASAGSSATPSLRFSGDGDSGFYQISTANQIGLSLGGSDAVRFINGGIPIRITGTSDPTQPSTRYGIYTTDFGTERAYWGFPTTGSDQIIMRNIVGSNISFRVSDNVTRLEVNTSAGAVVVPVDNASSASTLEVGWRICPQNIRNTNYTLVLGDSNCHIYKASGGAGETITIPANGSVAFPIGTMITFVNDGGGTLTIAITTDTMQMSPGGATGSRTLADNGVATALKVTSTLWKIWGTGLS